MDNFNNCTIEGGALVTTRRGLQVSKAKHNGISFVNIIAGPEQASEEAPQTQLSRRTDLVDLSQPLERRFKFVTKNQEPRKPRVFQPKKTTRATQIDSNKKSKPKKAQTNAPRILSSQAGPIYLYDPALASSEEVESLDRALEEFQHCYQSTPFLSTTSWRAEVWATHNYSVPMSVTKQKLLHLYMRFIPFKMYPLECILSHNPTRSPKFFERLQVTPNSLVSVIVAGSLVEAVLKGERCSDDMLEQESYACGVVNGELRKIARLRGQEAHGIMECICSMAVGSAHLGRHDHWHMHMKGLKQILEMTGGIDKEWTYVMNKVRRANVKAAAALATIPYLEYERIYGNISDSLPRTTRARLSKAVKGILAFCNVQEVICESFASLVLFSHAVSTALAAKKRTILYDPEVFIEEWLWVMPPISRAFRPGSSGSSVGRVVSGNRNPRQDEHSMDVDHAETSRVKEPAAVQAAVVKPPPPEPDHLKIEESLKWIMDLLRKTGTGYFAASQFRGHDAVQSYSSLPRSQQETPWVLAQVGKAHYEQAAYAEAEKYFRKLRVLAPSRMEDMEVYSTILWHLKRETDLSFLAHELIDSEWLAPQAWCTLGNAWSLAREPDQALRCFRRATQVDPKFAYAFTLQGHEHVANEEYEKALGAYRQAITADQRHYNAYYGMGKVHEKLGNYDKARIHFHTASMINPTNAVLICCVGSVLEKQKQMGLALQAFTKATELAPRAAQTRYQKARALLAVGQLEAAQKELLILKDLAPDEANVHFLLGKMYIRTGEKQSAVRHFTVALALDPKASPQVKEAIESIEDDQGMEDSFMT
ncbi:hypothetical protein BN1723_012074 [Verticillium longisporum]|uniref:Uncharacterized protein n=1 Tax=Verticillium longisporum TaxID=100787 RepID=A0A0G4LDW5_VERLO|nr:hypothetical protein BN1723_012074 [Verticillium longisporum]